MNSINVTPLKRKSVVQEIIDGLTEAMIEGSIKAGDKLPPEPELASMFGVGRNSVREAIKVLECMGVVEIKRAEGTFVCHEFSKRMIDPMIYGIILSQDGSYDKLMELRELMEVGVINLAIEHGKVEKLALLKKSLDILGIEIAKGPENIEKIFEADNQFHQIIIEMGENQLVDKINEVVRILTQSVRLKTADDMMKQGRGEEFYQAHVDLYDIILSGKAADYRFDVRKTYFFDEGQGHE